MYHSDVTDVQGPLIQLGGLGDGWGRFLTNHREEAVHLFGGETVATRKVGGGVAVEQHLVEFFSQTAQTVHAKFNEELDKYHYNAATFFSSFLMALLMKSLMVMPVAATNAASFECNSDDILRFSFPL